MIAMEHYVDQLIKDWPQVLYRMGPGTKDTFKVDIDSALLCKRARKLLHRTVAKILYPAKRMRTDVITVISFLCTQVTKATEEDQCKLERLLGYFKLTKGRKLFIKASGLMQIRAFIDAFFALHFDSKSHTGANITVGGAVVYVVSRKQNA